MADALLPGTSAGCTVALGGQLTNNNGLRQCLDTTQLMPVITNGGSIITPMNTWLEGMCPLKPCEQQYIDGAKTAISRDCGEEQKKKTSLVNLIKMSLDYYPAVRRILCDKDQSGEFCVTQVATTVQNVTGQPFTVDYLQKLFGGDKETLQSVNETLQSGQLCTDCFSHMLAEANKINPDLVDGPIGKETERKCGPGFIRSMNDTQTATTTGSEESSSSSGALSIASASIGLSAAGMLAFSAYVL